MARDGTRTRQKLSEAALRLFVEKGIGETTTRDITGAAGVAEGTLYRHFESREDMAWTLFRDNYADYARRMRVLVDDAEDPVTAIGAIVRNWCAAFDREPDVFRYLLLLQHEYVRRVTPDMESPVKELRRLMKRLIDADAIGIDDPSVAVALVQGPLLQIATSIIYGELEGPLIDWAPTIEAATLRVLDAKGA